MHTIKHFMLVAALCLPTVLNAQDSTKHTLPEGTVISAQLLDELSSGSATAGDIVQFKTFEPVIIGADTLVPQGTRMTGRVIEAAPRRGAGKAGKLVFSIDYLNMPTGKNIKLIGEQKAEGATKVGAAVAEAVLLTPLFLLKKGKDVKYEAGQVFKVFVEKDTPL